MDCDRVVIAAGRSGAVPSYFDSGVAGLGASPIASLGAGFAKVVEGEPVLVDIVHVHRGYVSDCTRIFSAGPLSTQWHERLEDMVQIRDSLVSNLGRGEDCSVVWEKGSQMAAQGVAGRFCEGGPRTLCLCGALLERTFSCKRTNMSGVI